MLVYKIESKNGICYSERDIQAALDKIYKKDTLKVEALQIDSRDVASTMPVIANGTEKIQPEIKDIIEAIRRYLAVNNGVCFIGSFTAFECKCKDCSKSGEDEIGIKDDASTMFAFGDLESLRCELNGLRDMVEDEVDEDGFVSV
jgi:hypothetical protein